MRWLAIVVVALMVACDDNGPEIPQATGSWEGTVSSAVVTLTLNENSDGEVSGSGNFTAPEDALSVSVEGTHAHPDISLILAAPGFEDTNFTGEFVEDDRITGRLNGSGFVNNALTLYRQ